MGTERLAVEFERRADGSVHLRLIGKLEEGTAALLDGILQALWQLALVGYATWAVHAAARAAARAHAVGADPAHAARAHLAESLEPGLRVSSSAGDVRVAVRVPRLPGLPSLGHVNASAHFEPQS